MDLPLIRVKITGKCIESELKYTPHEGDEVEDLYIALKQVKVEVISSFYCRNVFLRLKVYHQVLFYQIIKENVLKMCTLLFYST